MIYNLPGNTGLKVSELCLGTMTFGGKDKGIWTNIGQVEQDGVNELLKSAVDAGRWCLYCWIIKWG